MGPQFIPNSPLFHIVRKYILYLFQRRFAPFGYNYISSKMFQRVKSGMNPSPYTFLAFLRKVPTASTRLWSSPPPGSGKILDKILIAYSATRTDLTSPFGFSQNLSPSLARIPTGSSGAVPRDRAIRFARMHPPSWVSPSALSRPTI